MPAVYMSTCVRRGYIYTEAKSYADWALMHAIGHTSEDSAPFPPTLTNLSSYYLLFFFCYWLKRFLKQLSSFNLARQFGKLRGGERKVILIYIYIYIYITYVVSRQNLNSTCKICSSFSTKQSGSGSFSGTVPYLMSRT